MNKIFKHFIIYILVFMTLINGIVPCTVLADEKTTDEITDFTGFTGFTFNPLLETNTVTDGHDVVEWISFNKEIYVYDEGEVRPLSESMTDFIENGGSFLYRVDSLAGMQLMVKESDWDDLYFLQRHPVSGESVGEPIKVSSSSAGLVSTVSGDDLQRMYEEDSKPKDTASFFESIITLFFITLGDGAMWAIGAVCGGNISLDMLIFNKYENTNLAIFKDSSYSSSEYMNFSNPFIDDSGVLGSIEFVYNIFMGIAATTFLTSLLYIGLKILFGSTGSGKAKYQSYLVTWVKGVLILFMFPFVMKIAIEINCALVFEIKSVGSGLIYSTEMPKMEEVPFEGIDTSITFGGEDLRDKSQLDLMGKLRKKAFDTGRLAYAICWLILIGQLIKFIYIYFKRLLMTLFLIAVFPLVTMTYAIDKVGDGKSQAFDSWVKEYMLNVFAQAFHALNYTIVMGIIGAIGSLGSEPVNFILILVAITYVAKGEDILRAIFGQTGGAGTVKSATESILKTAGAVTIARNMLSGIKNTGKRFSALNDARRGITDRNLAIADARINEKNAALTEAHKNDANPPAPLSAYYPVSRNASNGLNHQLDAFMALDENSDKAEVRKVLDDMSAFKDDPVFQKMLLDKGLDVKEVMSLLEQREAAESRARGLEVNVKNNLDILINRKSRDGKSQLMGGYYDMLGDKLLAAYGITYASLLYDKKQYDEMQTKKNKFDKMNNHHKESAQKYKTGGAARKEAQKLGNVNGTSNTETTGNGFTRQANEANGNNTKTNKGTNRSPITTDPTMRGYTDTIKGFKISKQTKEKARVKRRNDMIRREEAMASQGVSDKVKERSILGYIAASEFSKNNGSVTTARSNEGNPIVMEYNDTTSRNAKREKTNQQKRTKQRVNEERRRQQVEEKQEQSATNVSNNRKVYRVSTPVEESPSVDISYYKNITADRDYYSEGRTAKVKDTTNGNSESATTRNNENNTVSNDNKGRKRTNQQKRTKQRLDAERKRRQIEEKQEQFASTAEKIDKNKRVYSNYAAMAAIAEELSSPDVSYYRKIVDDRDFELEVEAAKDKVTTDEEKASIDAAANAMREQMDIDEDTQRLISNVKRTVHSIFKGKQEKGESLSENDKERIYESVTAAEILRTGRGTLEDLWNAYYTCDNYGIDKIGRDSIDEYLVNLAVETLNNVNELNGSVQTRVDDAIRVIKAHRYDNGICGELIKKLRFDPDRLFVGQLPTTLKKEEETPIKKHEERSPEVNKILSSLSERREEIVRMEAEHKKSSYNNGKSFDLDKAKKERNKAVLDFGKEVIKETLHDTAAVTGAAVGLSMYAAIDTKNTIPEVVGAVGVGKSLATNTVDTITYYGDEVYDRVSEFSDRLINVRGERNKDGNPIKLNKDGKRK